MQPSQQEVSSAICGFAAIAKLSISISAARCSQHCRAGIVTQMWHESHMPFGALHPLRGHWGLFLCRSLLSTHLSPLGEILARGAPVDCTGGQGGERLRREGGTGDSDPWNRGAQRDSSTPVSLPLLFFCCSLLLWRVAEKMFAGAVAPSHLQGKCTAEYTVHLI